MNKEDKKIQKHLVDEMMKVSKTNPDVMIYMQTLMKKYEELEQENINIKQELLANKISLKDIEYKEKIKYKERIDKAIEYIKHEWFKREQIGISHLSFSYDELQKILNILNGDEE